MSADIFISFASKDVKIALTLCQAIESRGFKCWISARDIQPGENFQVAIVQALRKAKILLLVFTANSNTSEEMTKELALASQQKMMVIPLRVEDVTPGDAFAYEFATRQWIDAFADWEFSIEQLCRRIGHALAGREEEAAAMDLPTVSLKPPEATPEPEAEPAPPPKTAKPVKAPPPPKPAPEPVANEDEPGVPRRRLGRLALAATLIVILGGVVVAALALARPKPAAVAAEAPAIVAPALPEAPAFTNDALPVANEVAEAEILEAPVEKPKPARKRKTEAPPSGAVDIPY